MNGQGSGIRGQGSGGSDSSFVIRASSFSPSFPRRSGVSLMEVLISIFVLAIGLLGLAALIPVGRFAIVETAKADRSGACGRAGLHEVKVRRMLDYRSWLPSAPPPAWWPAVATPDAAPPNVPIMEPFAIDPLGVAEGMPPALGGPAGPIPRITLGYLANFPTQEARVLAAEQIFTWPDELRFEVTGDIRARRLVMDRNGETGAYPPLPAEPPLAPPVEPQSNANYSWLVTVCPAAAELPLPVSEKRLYSVSIVVCYKRVYMLPNGSYGEHATAATFLGSGWGGGSVQLAEAVNVKQNEWIMLCGGGQGKWYRVVAAGENPTNLLSLTGPDWRIDNDADGKPDPAQAVIIDSVVGVYSTTVELDWDPLWTN